MAGSHETPPAVLDRLLEVGPGDWSERDFYLLMTAMVVPRPIGWISTLSASGVRNLAPYSYFNLMGSDPFYIAFGSTGAKDTGRRGKGGPRMRGGADHLRSQCHIVLGRIVHAHVDPSVWRDGRVDPALLDPVCRLGGSGYAALGELVNVQRPTWKKVQGTRGPDAMPRAVKRR